MYQRRMIRSFGEAPVQTPAPVDQPYIELGCLLFQRTLLLNQALLDVQINNDQDSDIELTHVVGTKTGNYTIRLKLPTGRYFTPAQVQDRNFVGTAQFPVGLGGGILVPRNGQISIDITDTSGAGNAIEILFKGPRTFTTRPSRY